MVFYPDNEKRATRLQQLVDSMANMQTDCKHDADEMDSSNADMRTKMDAVLSAAGIDSIDTLIAKATAKMTPEEKKQWESLIEAAKKSKAGFDWTYFAGSILMVPEGVVLTSQVILAAGRFVVRMSVVQQVAAFFRSAEGGESAAAGTAEAVAQSAAEAEKGIQDAGLAGEGSEELLESVSILSKVGTFFKILGAVGLVVTLITGIIEAVEGAEQKTKLVDAIHQCQPARLDTAFFKREAANILQQLALMSSYLDALPGGSDPDEDAAAYLSKKIVKNIQAANSKIDWTALETELENQDKSAGNYYGGDDLSLAQVVQIASSDSSVQQPQASPPKASPPKATPPTATPPSNAAQAALAAAIAKAAAAAQAAADAQAAAAKALAAAQASHSLQAIQAAMVAAAKAAAAAQVADAARAAVLATQAAKH